MVLGTHLLGVSAREGLHSGDSGSRYGPHSKGSCLAVDQVRAKSWCLLGARNPAIFPSTCAPKALD